MIANHPSGKNRELQRYTVPYAKILGVTGEDTYAEEDAMEA